MKNNPVFSVIIPTYNRAGFLPTAVESVLRQSFPDLELIVVDDGSSDGTVEYLETIKDDRIRMINQPNRGPSSARNTGIRNARGRYLAFLDSDDWWLKGKLQKAMEAIEGNPGHGIYHTQERWFRNGELLNQKKIHRKPKGDIFARCLRLCCVSMSTAVVKREVIEKTGLFDENLPSCEDYDFWLRASVHFTAHLTDEVLTEKEGGHADQQSARYWGMDRFRIKSIVRLLEGEDLTARRRRQAVKELSRKCRIYGGGCRKRGKLEEAVYYRRISELYSGASG